MKKLSSQKERVLAYVRTYGSITHREAEDTYSITRIAAVVFDLKALGHKFRTEDVKSKNKFGESCSYARYHYEGMATPLERFARSNQQNHDLVASLLEDK